MGAASALGHPFLVQTPTSAHTRTHLTFHTLVRTAPGPCHLIFTLPHDHPSITCCTCQKNATLSPHLLGQQYLTLALELPYPHIYLALFCPCTCSLSATFPHTCQPSTILSLHLLTKRYLASHLPTQRDLVLALAYTHKCLERPPVHACACSPTHPLRHTHTCMHMLPNKNTHTPPHTCLTHTHARAHIHTLPICVPGHPVLAHPHTLPRGCACGGGPALWRARCAARHHARPALPPAGCGARIQASACACARCVRLLAFRQHCTRLFEHLPGGCAPVDWQVPSATCALSCG